MENDLADKADCISEALGALHKEIALANEDTFWPDGFDPAAAGVIFDRQASIPSDPFSRRRPSSLQPLA